MFFKNYFKLISVLYFVSTILMYFFFNLITAIIQISMFLLLVFCIKAMNKKKLTDSIKL